MRNRRLVRVGLFVVAALAVINIAVRIWPAWDKGYDLTLQISTPQKEYKLGDEIPVIFTIKNNGRNTFPENEPLSERIWPKRTVIGGHVGPTTSYGIGALVRHKEGKPCLYAGNGRGLWRRYSAEEIRVKGGASLSKSCTLNAHVLLSKPGTYTVTGTFGPGLAKDSEPLDIVVKERSAKEMEEHVSSLVQACRKARGLIARLGAMRRLMYTRDGRAAPALIELEYSGGAPSEAFEEYLPISDRVKELLLDAAMKRGLTHNIFGALVRFGCSEAELKDVIRKWLRSEDARSMAVALRAAEYFPDDSNMSLLAKLAKDDDYAVKCGALRALAFNRSEEGVKVLEEALRDGDREIRRTAKDAIKAAFRSEHMGYSGWQPWVWLDWDYHISYWWGRPPHEGNVGQAATAQVSDANSCTWAKAVSDLLDALSREEFEIVRKLADGLYENTEDANDAVKAIRDLLTSADQDVRDVTRTRIRFAPRNPRGRPLREEDFPEVYAEYKRERASGEYE